MNFKVVQVVYDRYMGVPVRLGVGAILMGCAFLALWLLPPVLFCNREYLTKGALQVYKQR